MEGVVLPESATALVVGCLEQELGSCGIYVYGYRSVVEGRRMVVPECEVGVVERHYYYLLVLTPRGVKKTAVHLANVVALAGGGRVVVHVLLHSLKDLSSRQVGMQWFYSKVLRDGVCLCTGGMLPYVAVGDGCRDVSGGKVYWDKCEAVARFYLDAAADSVHVSVGLCKIALLHTAVLQVALGMLRVYMGYVPKEYGLRYLLGLCGCFTALPEEVFGGGSVDSVRCYKLLCAPPSMLNHWTRLYVAEEDFERLLVSCRSFLDLASVQVAGVLVTDKK